MQSYHFKAAGMNRCCSTNPSRYLLQADSQAVRKSKPSFARFGFQYQMSKYMVTSLKRDTATPLPAVLAFYSGGCYYADDFVSYGLSSEV